MNLSFPYAFDHRGRTSEATEARHIRNLMEQLLFTSPGERVNRPEFGTGLRKLVFAGNSPELASATQLLIHGALQQYLGDRVQIEAVDVSSQEATLLITIRYHLRLTQERRLEHFTHSNP